MRVGAPDGGAPPPRWEFNGTARRRGGASGGREGALWESAAGPGREGRAGRARDVGVVRDQCGVIHGVRRGSGRAGGAECAGCHGGSTRWAGQAVRGWQEVRAGAGSGARSAACSVPGQHRVLYSTEV